MRFALVGLVILLGLPAMPVKAGPFADELGKCLVRKATQAQIDVFMRFIYVFMSANPAVKDLANLSPEQIDTAARDTAKMIQASIAENCPNEAKEAIKYEDGKAAFEAAFSAYGGFAGRQMGSHPDVSLRIAEYSKYLDTEKLRKALGIK